MIRDEAFETLLADWLQEGPFEAPTRGVQAAVDHAWAHPRGRARWLPWTRRRPTDLDLRPAPVEPVRPALSRAWVIALVAALLALIVVTFVVGSRWLAPASLGNGRLALSWAGDVWTVDPAGGDPRNVTATSTEIETSPAWSPDGRWLAIRSRIAGTFTIDLMRPDGSDRHRLSSVAAAADGPIAWSPDSRSLATGLGSGSVSHLTILDAAAGGPPLVIDAVSGSSPAWSPDGRRIAFVGQPPTEARRDLFLVERDGTGLRRLTSAANLPLGRVSHPSWAEDGRTIVFDDAVLEGGGIVHRILALAIDGTQLRPVGPDRAWSTDQELASGPTVAPDGRRVAFAGEGWLWLTRLDSSDVRPLAPGPGPDGIEWAPDGSRVAYLEQAPCAPASSGGTTATANCLTGLRSVDPDGSDQRTIWSPPATSDAPATFSWDLAWQPLPAKP